MPMTLYMIWMARTCKVDEFVLNWQGIHVTDVEVDSVVAEDEEMVVAAAVDADLVEILPDQEPTIAWLWKICPQGLLGRI